MTGPEPGGIVSVETDADGDLLIGVRDEPEGSAGQTCPHPPAERRLHDGEQLCLGCGQILDDRIPEPAIVPKDRPGTTDPTRREGDERAGGLRHITGAGIVGGPRPYAPDEVEREIVDTLDRIERGAGWLTTKEEERAAAKMDYELKFARYRYNSNGRSAEQRADDALLQCREEYERWQLLELQCRTAREGMHNLRSKLSGLQSVLRSITAAVGGYQ